MIGLGFVGANPPEGFWVQLGQICTLYYFVHLLVILPLLGKLERPKPLPTSISEAVLKKNGGGAATAGAAAKPMEKA